MISRILSLEAFAGAASLLHDTIFRVLLFREVDEDLLENKTIRQRDKISAHLQRVAKVFLPI